MGTENRHFAGDASLTARDQYVREVRWMERLTREEEECLVQRLVRARAEKEKPHPNQWVLSLAYHARETLIECYQGLVLSIARRYVARCRSLDLLDLVQEANIGLLRLLDEGEFHCGKQLCALAILRIRGSIQNAIRDHDGLVRVAAWAQELAGKVRVAHRELVGELGREPLLAEVAKRVGVSQEKVHEVMQLHDRAQGVQSIQALLLEDQDEDTVHFVSLFESGRIDESERSRGLEAVIQQAVDEVLTVQQREVIGLRYGLGEQGRSTYSIPELAEAMEKCDSNLRKIDQRAKDRLRSVLASACGYEVGLTA